MKRVHAFITGTVQGVTFRASTRQRAQDAGVDGWVRNLDDGRVEAVFEGDEDDVAELVNFIHHGPAPADVEDVELTEEEPRELDGFEVRY